MTESTTYNAENPIKVIVHGWLGNDQNDNDSLCVYNMKCKLANYIFSKLFLNTSL